MSAQNPPRRSLLSGVAGIAGFSALAGLLVTVMVAPVIAVTGVTASSTIGIFDGLPEYIEIGQLPEVNTLYAVSNREGNVDGYVPIATVYDQNRQEVTWDQISPFARDAVVAGEDRRFFTHGGVDIASVIRASIGNVVSSDIESGASTLSMQYVKNTNIQAALEMPTEEEREAAYDAAIATSFERKLKEMKLAIGLEKNYTKKEILVAYLNIANFGNATYGIQAAAQRYFSVNAADLTLAQSASLIAIVQQPSARNLGDPENYPDNIERRDQILNNMLELGYITQVERDEAVAVPLDETTVLPSMTANGCLGANAYAKWFCDYVVKSVKDFEFLGASEDERSKNWKRGGYKLYTTLDLDVQEQAQDATWTYAPNTETGFSLGSATSTVQAGTGRILVMTENKLFDNTFEGGGPTTSAVNYNTTLSYGGSTGFQPGSTYKLFTLLAWLEAGKGLNERVNGDSRTFDQAKFANCEGTSYGGPWKPRNASGERGNFDIIQGTVSSINGVFASMGLQLNQCETKRIAESLGIQRGDETPLLSNPAAILGTNEISPLSLAGAYAAIGANGKWCAPIAVDRATGPDGADLPGQAQDCKQAIDPEVAATATYALRQVVTQGTGSRSDPDDGTPIAGKTGTTDGSNQTWMATFTTGWGTAVWVGNSINEYDMFDYEAAGVGGASLRYSISRATAGALDSKYPGGDFPPPADRLMTGSGLAVPSVLGQSFANAKTLLEGVGFEVADGGQVDSEQPVGQVVQTDPPEGTTSAKGAVITLYMSKGNKVPFPDVVANGKTNDFNAAKSSLVSQGYVNVSEACAVITDPIPLPGTDPRVGKVSASNPAPGSLVVPGVPVTLTVTKLTC
jgi:membrane peptidoglycan carboxypeptidase